MKSEMFLPLRAGLPLLLLLATCSARAEVKVPALFTDHAVLQQGQDVPVWGWADHDERVSVTFRDQTVSTKAKNGQWRVNLKKLTPGKPAMLTIRGVTNRIMIHDVLVGEVWIASGQSNMEWPLSRSLDSTNDIAAAANPMIRLFTVPKLKAKFPTNDIASSWQECSPETVPGFSAVAYYFGRDLQKNRQVPVGLIHTSWGGSPAEAWMSSSLLAEREDYRQTILDAYEPALRKYEDARALFDMQTVRLKEQGLAQTNRAPYPPWRPGELYDGMIAPLIPYAIKGAIWYQGEANAGRAHQYRKLFPYLIFNWRSDWHQDDFPFLAVQLAPFDKNKKRTLEEISAAPVESDWAELREAQLYSTKVLPKVGLAVITDAGEQDDIHPRKKEPVGARLALAARHLAYGEKLTWSGPLFKSMTLKYGNAILSFDHVGGGLEARGGNLTGFTICGEDRKFVRAKAEIIGDKIFVSSSEVLNPVAVRFGWADYPVVNLFNKEGLPASPFRTDDFPMLTAPKAK